MSEIEINNKITVKTTGYINEGILKTHPTEVGEWYGSGTICQVLSIDSIIDEVPKPDGEYKITVTIEKVNE